MEIKNIDLKEHREKLVTLGGVTIFLLILYFLIYNPTVKYMRIKEEINNYEVKSRKEKKLLEVMEKRVNRLEEERNSEIKNLEEARQRIREKSFSNLVEFEEYIGELLEKNFLTVEAIGRVERITETDKIYIPYVIKGGDFNILNFMESVESDERGISLSETPSQLLKEGDITKFNCKISANVLNIKEEDTKEKRLNIKDFVRYGIKEIKYLNYNNRRYIIVNFQNGGSEIFYQGEIVEKDGKKYKILVEDNEIYLELVRE